MDKRDISNWRPISLINVDVKIGSNAIAKRLESVLPSIIYILTNVHTLKAGLFLMRLEH